MSAPKPYVYMLIHRETGKFYIGARVANKVSATEDLGKKYFTSSKKIKPIFDQFEAHVVAEFLDRKTTFDVEQSIIREFWGDPDLLNENYFVVTDKTIRVFDHTKTEEHKRKISESNRGKSRAAGSKNPRYGRGDDLKGAKNPRALVWTIVNNKTGETYNTDDLRSFAKVLGVPYSTLAQATTFNPNRTWFSTRTQKTK